MNFSPKCSIFLFLLALLSKIEGKPYDYDYEQEPTRLQRQVSSSSAAASSSSSSSSNTNPQTFGIGAAAGIGGLGAQTGLGSFNADTRSNPFLPFGAFAGINLPNSGRIGAGCTGLSCGFQLGDYVAQFPFFRNSQGNSFLGTRINKVDTADPINKTSNENTETSAPAEIVETKIATPSSSPLEGTAQIPPPIPKASERTITEMTAEVQRNTANLMRTAQDFLSNLLGGLRDFSSNLAGLFQGNSTGGIRASVTFPTFPTVRSTQLRQVEYTTSTQSPSTSSKDEDTKRKIIDDSDAFKNLIVL